MLQDTPLPPPDTPDNMALLSQTSGPQWGGVWLGPQEKQGPTYTQEATCSFEGVGPQGTVTQTALQFGPGAGGRSVTQVCFPPEASGPPSLSSRDQRGLFGHVSVGAGQLVLLL